MNPSTVQTGMPTSLISSLTGSFQRLQALFRARGGNYPRTGFFQQSCQQVASVRFVIDDQDHCAIEERNGIACCLELPVPFHMRQGARGHCWKSHMERTALVFARALGRDRAAMKFYQYAMDSPRPSPPCRRIVSHGLPEPLDASRKSDMPIPGRAP